MKNVVIATGHAAIFLDGRAQSHGAKQEDPNTSAIG